MDPAFELKLEVFEFFKRTIIRIDRLEKLRLMVQEAIEKRVEETADDMPLEDLRALYASTSAEVNRANEAIISLFRPVPGAPSILANSVGNVPDPGASTNDFYNRLSPADRALFDRLSAKLINAGSESSSAS